MIICTSITESYLQRSKPFFESVVTHWAGRRICFTIGFSVTIEGWECISVPPSVKSWQPKNRQNYASLQHGEWTKYLNVPPEEMVCFVDSDMVLQRPFDLDLPPTNSVLATSCSWPSQLLISVAHNLGCKQRGDKFIGRWRLGIHQEFCACFMIAKMKIWRAVYAESLGLLPMLKQFEHHAAWQLLINLAVHRVSRVIILPKFVCNAAWYTGTKATDVDGELWVDSVSDANGKITSEKVYFNHTKFIQL